MDASNKCEYISKCQPHGATRWKGGSPLRSEWDLSSGDYKNWMEIHFGILPVLLRVKQYAGMHVAPTTANVGDVEPVSKLVQSCCLLLCHKRIWYFLGWGRNHINFKYVFKKKTFSDIMEYLSSFRSILISIKATELNAPRRWRWMHACLIKSVVKSPPYFLVLFKNVALFCCHLFKSNLASEGNGTLQC